MNKKVTYIALVCINPTVPTQLSKEKIEKLKDGENINTAPGILYTLENNGYKPKDEDVHIKDGRFIRFTFEKEYEEDSGFKEARKSVIDKFMGLRKVLNGLPATIVLHSHVEKPKKVKTKKPSNNKAEKPKDVRVHKFSKSDKTRMPRKTKKAIKKAKLKVIANAASMSRSQIKRSKFKAEILEFVNVMCEQKFTTYAQAMKYIRSKNGEKKVMAAAA